MINMKTEHWTSNQAWAVYQLMEKIREELLTHHNKSIQTHRYLDRKLEEYAAHIEQMSEEEMEDDIWLEDEEFGEEPF